MRVRAGVILAIITITLGNVAPAWGQPKTDIVTMNNGDRITGQVQSLSRGQLELKTDNLGTIYIEWDKVARVQAISQFEVTTSSGRRLLGSLASTTDGALLVALQGQFETIPMFEVTNIAPIGASFWSKLEGSVDAGYSYTRSSGIAQATFGSDTQFRRPAFLVRLTGSATVTKQEEAANDDRAAVSLSYVRYRWAKWFVASAGTLENNTSLGLELRAQLAGMIGRRIVNTNRAQFVAGGGLVGNNEKGVDTDSTQNFEGLLTTQMSYYLYDKPKTSIDAVFQYYPSLNQWGRQRVQIDADFKRELVKNFTLSFSFYYTFDSNPPQTGALRTDYGIITSAGWTFGR